MAPQFVRFVRAVEGRLVSRWDVGPTQYFGARLGTPEERTAGKPVIWDTAQVIPLTAEFVASYSRELGKALRHGDLEEVKLEAYEAWIAAEKAGDEKATIEREAAVAKAKADAEPKPVVPPSTDGAPSASPPAPSPDDVATQPDPAPAPVAEASDKKSEKRK